MSQRYKGAVISATPPTASTSGAPGEWTLQQQMQAQGAGTWPFGGPFNYIEDVFSTYLTTGAGSNITVVNGIDLSTKGGLVWIKPRNTADYHTLFDTARGVNKGLYTNTTDAQTTISNWLPNFNTNGFEIGSSNNATTLGTTAASWTFRKQAKFFDVVTYTGNGSNRTIAHNLGSVPGCIIVKRTDTTGAWQVYHRSLANTEYMVLNTTAAKATGTTRWNSTTPTSTDFSLGTDATVNANSGTYVAYLFAHDAGGFGTTNTDNVISCGSFTTSGTAPGNATVNLGYEPQFVLWKQSNGIGDWRIVDTMRGFFTDITSPTNKFLRPNTTTTEGNAAYLQLTTTGFTTDTGADAQTYIYIAIRRGPMKVPTTGTSVFAPTTYTGTGSTNQTLTTNFPVDMYINCDRTNSANMTSYAFPVFTRKLSLDNALQTASTATWGGGWGSSYWLDDSNTSLTVVGAGGISYNNQPGVTYVNYNFSRAPGFMDVVSDKGTGSIHTIPHNLKVKPELIIRKCLTTAANQDWWVYSSPTTATSYLILNFNGAVSLYTPVWNDTEPTSTNFTVGTYVGTNNSGTSYVTYLFASCPGVSKVGSYSGTGATQTISCGFAARFVLIKRTDSSGNWWYWDTSRGMVSGTDPRMAFNVAAAETNANWVYTDASGFQIVTTDATVNASGGTYIFLAIA